jgi:predicted nucleic acid-binding protein
MVIIDTTVWIDYLRGNNTPQTAWLERETMRQPLGLTDLILCEVLQGISDSRTFSDFRDDLVKLHVFETGGVELAIAAAENYQRLRQRAYAVRKTIGCLMPLSVYVADTACCIAIRISIPSKSCLDYQSFTHKKSTGWDARASEIKSS